MNLLFGLFLVAHGLVHGLFMVPRPPDAGASWPFDPSESWLLNQIGVEPDLARAIAGILPADWLRPIAIASASVSLILLGIFFHPWLVIGIAIDAAILWAVGLNGWIPG
jgi:hypothetical protein